MKEILIDLLGAEPQPTRGLPPCPDFLKDAARREYFRIGRKLERIGVLTEVDDLALVGPVRSWMEYLECTEKIRETGMLLMSPGRFPIFNPYTTLRRSSMNPLHAPSKRTEVPDGTAIAR